MDGGLGLPVARNGVSAPSQPRVSNVTTSSSGLPRVPGGPTVIEEPFKKLKKPPPQSQASSRSSTPTPSGGRAEAERKQGGEGRGLAASTSIKSLSDSSSADTTDSKVSCDSSLRNCVCRAVAALRQKTAVKSLGDSTTSAVWTSFRSVKNKCCVKICCLAAASFAAGRIARTGG